MHACRFVHTQGNLLERYTRSMGLAAGSGWDLGCLSSSVLFSFVLCLVTLPQGQRKVEKESGGWFPYTEYLLRPQYLPPHPPVSPLVHPRRPLIEPETAQLLCRPSALLAGPRGAARPAARGTKGRTKDPLCCAPAPAEPQDQASPVTVPEGFPAPAPPSPRANALPGSPVRRGGGSPWSQSYPILPLFISASKASSPWWRGLNQAVRRNPETQAE